MQQGACKGRHLGEDIQRHQVQAKAALQAPAHQRHIQRQECQHNPLCKHPTLPRLRSTRVWLISFSSSRDSLNRARHAWLN